MMIDWTKPIELATEPPRRARVIGKADIDGSAAVCAEWREGDSEEEQAVPFYVLHTGYVNIDPAGHRYPRVRNVVAAPDLAAELAEALRQALAKFGPGWSNGDAGEAMHIMGAALAKYEAQEKAK